MEYDDFKELSKGFIPPNTVADTRKCVRLFQDWAKDRNAPFPGDKIPQDILLTDDHQSLSCWLCKFALRYARWMGLTILHAPSSTTFLVSSATSEPASRARLTFSLTVTSVVCASWLTLCTASSIPKALACSINHTETLTDEDEEKLWQSGVLNPDTPQGLLNCVFFLNGKNFCLRGGAEHRDLKISQLKRPVVKLTGKYVVRYTYTQHVFKNRAGGLKQIKQASKIVHQYESTDLNRCHVLLLNKYLSKLPREAYQRDTFYLRAKAALPANAEDSWFTPVPIGRNVLGQMMKAMATAGKLEKAVTNHSLRSYGVSKMFRGDVPKKLIMERSGHRSLKGVRQYERTSACIRVKLGKSQSCNCRNM